jgi:diguanylate cyclase (GGDEF)-like protein
VSSYELAISSGILIGADRIADWLSRDNHHLRNSPILWGIVLDVDQHTQLNKQFGYSVGNKILQSIASLLTSIDTLLISGRCGDDTFFAVAIYDRSEISALGKTSLEQVQLVPAGLNLPQARLTVSMGIAEHTGVAAKIWLEQAYHACCQAKHGGGNDIKFWEPRKGGQAKWS